MKDLLPHFQAEGEDLTDRGEWKQVPVWHSRQPPLLPTSSSQVVPLCTLWYEALEIDGQANDNVDHGPSTPGESPRQVDLHPTSQQSPPRKKKGYCHSGLPSEGNRVPDCHPDPAHREACCLIE